MQKSFIQTNLFKIRRSNQMFLRECYHKLNNLIISLINFNNIVIFYIHFPNPFGFPPLNISFCSISISYLLNRWWNLYNQLLFIFIRCNINLPLFALIISILLFIYWVMLIFVFLFIAHFIFLLLFVMNGFFEGAIYILI